jgi:hypothetical protein
MAGATAGINNGPVISRGDIVRLFPPREVPVARSTYGIESRVVRPCHVVRTNRAQACVPTLLVTRSTRRWCCPLITKGREGRGSLLRCLHRDDQKNAFNRITAKQRACCTRSTCVPRSRPFSIRWLRMSRDRWTLAVSCWTVPRSWRSPIPESGEPACRGCGTAACRKPVFGSVDEARHSGRCGAWLRQNL